MISYTSQFSVISALCRKKWILSVNININNFAVYFKDDIAVKLSFIGASNLCYLVTDFKSINLKVYRM